MMFLKFENNPFSQRSSQEPQIRPTYIQAMSRFKPLLCIQIWEFTQLQLPPYITNHIEPGLDSSPFIVFLHLFSNKTFQTSGTGFL